MNVQPFVDCVKTLLEPSFGIIERMEAQGLDLNKPRPVTHLLVGPDEGIEKAAKVFENIGFNIAEQSGGRLVIIEEASVSKEWLKQIIPAYCSTAAQYGLTYDGWDVDVSKEGLKRN